MTPSLSERLAKNLEDMRLLVKEYNLLSDDEKKSTRHLLYTKTGGFGRKYVELFKPFTDIEAKINPSGDEPKGSAP